MVVVAAAVDAFAVVAEDHYTHTAYFVAEGSGYPRLYDEEPDDGLARRCSALFGLERVVGVRVVVSLLWHVLQIFMIAMAVEGAGIEYKWVTRASRTGQMRMGMGCGMN